MSTFDKIIGYQDIKNELMQICDMIQNKGTYQSLGAKMPKGILLCGKPGLGKTLMARCLMEQCGLPSYTLRRSKNANDFLNEISNTFNLAKNNVPAFILLDDMDKFANEDERHRDAPEYVAIQAAIDEVRAHDVFIIATVNDINKLPISLTRPGRFDRKIEICSPTENDASEIIKHYLQDKKISPDVNMEDLTRMISYSSCAELETILNEAAIYAAFARRSHIIADDLFNAVLRVQHDAYGCSPQVPKEELEKIALHEAGHIVVCEVLCPGSVGLASLRANNRNGSGGFVLRCKELIRKPFDILAALGGKAAVALYHCDTHASGCRADIRKALNDIRSAVSQSGAYGLGLVDVGSYRFPEMSESLNARSEAVVQAELERYLLKAQDILLKNKSFLEKVALSLLAKETLLYSDIKAIKESVPIVDVFV